MVNSSIVLCTLQLSLFCSCSCRISSINRDSTMAANIVAKYHAIDLSDTVKGGNNDQYAVILSNEKDNEFRPKYQQQYAPTQHGNAAGNYQPHQPQQINPLLKQASTASIGILFVLLIWRSLAAYELADQFNAGSFRIIAVAPTVTILCANLMGFVINVMKPYNFKNLLKFILALNITREFIELLYNVMMLVINTSNSGISRDVYFGRFFMNVWWLSLCVTFSKSRWVLQIMPSSAAGNLGPNSNNYQQQQQQTTPRNYQTAQDPNGKYQ